MIERAPHPSWMRACFGFAAVLMVAGVALFTYRHMAEQQLLRECQGDKRLLRKKKRGSAYADLENHSTSGTSYVGANYAMKCTKTWTSDSDTPYHRLM